MEILYKGTNIYDEVQVTECIYESCCCNKSNYLRIRFSDESYKFDSYGMEINDAVRVKDGDIDSKDLYVNDIVPLSGSFEIIAKSLKADAYRGMTDKKWNGVQFKQVMNDIAGRHGMTCDFYGVPNSSYKNLTQYRERDFDFAAKIAVLEGCVIVIYDGKMIVSRERYLEKGETKKQLDIDTYTHSIRRSGMNHSMTVYTEDQSISGKYQISGGDANLVQIMEVDKKADAERFAQNLLRYHNKNGYVGVVQADTMLDEYSAGMVVEIKSKDHPTAAGKAFIYRVRQDMVQGKTKIWFRKCLEY